MTRQDEDGCFMIIIIGGLFLIIKIPIIIVYIIGGVIAISLVTLFLNILHTLYLIIFSRKIKLILKFDDDKTKKHFENLLQINQPEKTNLDEKYFHFISSSKIFDC
jgi:hypothetical protein